MSYVNKKRCVHSMKTKTAKVSQRPSAEVRGGAMEDALVWVDCEMTGLGAHGGPGDDVLLEIAVIVTDPELNVVAETIQDGDGQLARALESTPMA